MEQGLVLHVGQEVRLADNRDWTNRFSITSESSDRIYTIAQRRDKKYWACSCPRWRSNPRRECKHLAALGLPGNCVPFEARIE